MINREDELKSKLSDHGLSFSDGEEIHRQVVGSFVDESSQFETLKQFVGSASRDSLALRFNSLLWPEYEFAATAGQDGRLESAGYSRVTGQAQVEKSPLEQAPWSMDASEFTDSFGPATITYRSKLFDNVLPAHEMLEFEWNGIRYGAGFSWGLFLFASKLWT